MAITGMGSARHYFEKTTSLPTPTAPNNVLLANMLDPNVVMNAVPFTAGRGTADTGRDHIIAIHTHLGTLGGRWVDYITLPQEA